MEVVEKTYNNWIEIIQLENMTQSEFFHFEIDLEEQEINAFYHKASITANEYRISNKTFVDIVIVDKVLGKEAVHFVIFISGDKIKAKKTINEFYSFLTIWGIAIGKAGRNVDIELNELYSFLHRVFSSITWEMLNRYAKYYTWEDFGELMFYTLFSPEVKQTKYRQREISKNHWEFVKNKSSIAEDIITLDEVNNGGLYCLFIKDLTLPNLHYGIFFIYVKKLSQVFELPLLLFSENQFKGSYITRCLIESKEKNIDSITSLFEINFQNGYLRGRAYTFGLNLNDVFKYNLEKIL